MLKLQQITFCVIQKIYKGILSIFTFLRHLSVKWIKCLILLLLILILTLTGYFVYRHYRHPISNLTTYEPPTMHVRTAMVTSGQLPTYIRAIGTLKANKQVVIQAQEGGIVESVHFSDGEKVKKDAVLLVFKTDLYQAQLKEAQAKSNLQKVHLDRLNTLIAQQAVSSSERDEAFYTYQMREAEVDMTQAKLAQLKILAPFNGKPSLKDITPGMYIKPGEELLTLYQLYPVQVEFKLGERFIHDINLGQIAWVDFDGLSPLQAKIIAIDTAVNKTDRMIRVRARITDNKNNKKNPAYFRLLPGRFVQVTMLEKLHAKSLLIPEVALEFEGSQAYVFVIVAGKAYRAPVTTGKRNGDTVEILAGLKAGMEVVTLGQFKLGEGFPVKVDTTAA